MFDLIIYKNLSLLNRTPNITELAIQLCGMSIQIIKKTLVKNAGVIDIGDDDAIVFKIESHNHPSFIEPYQGAATGVGGIMRDVFTMGARPINLNSIHFGSPQNKKTKNLLRGVVKGKVDMEIALEFQRLQVKPLLMIL